jgi:hypothetical protein
VAEGGFVVIFVIGSRFDIISLTKYSQGGRQIVLGVYQDYSLLILKVQTKKPNVPIYQHSAFIGLREKCGQYVAKPTMKILCIKGSKAFKASMYNAKLFVYCQKPHSKAIANIFYCHFKPQHMHIKLQMIKTHKLEESKLANILWLPGDDLVLWFKDSLQMLVFKRITKYNYFRVQISLAGRFKFTDVVYDERSSSIILLTGNHRMAWVRSKHINSHTKSIPQNITVMGHIINTQLYAGCPIGNCFLDADGSLLQVIYFGNKRKRIMRIDVYEPHYSDANY